MNSFLRSLFTITVFVLLVITNINIGKLDFRISGTAYAGTSADIWSDISESSIILKGERRIIPQTFRTVKANYAELKSLLANAPAEFTEASKTNPLTISLPSPDGGYSLFEVVSYSMMEDGLARKFPEIRTFTIKGISDPYATGKLDITIHGFHAMIQSPSGNYFIDPYSTNEVEFYVSYYKKDYTQTQSFECLTDIYSGTQKKENYEYRGAIVAGPQLRSYRLAMAATGEYTVFHGGTVQAGLAAIVTAMNRVNGVYEKDLCVRMVLIANNNLIVYTNGSTDPYSNNNGGTMLGQNQTNLDNVIGSANYDIGHVFSTGGGGVAFLRCVCVDGIKAQGVTGLFSPIGDPFYIDYVAHEIGHQYGGNHSFNSTSGGCGGGNRNPGTAWEPGSGSTIMSYAGLCGGDDLQSNSDDIFHTGNFSEMAQFTQFGTGNSCAAITNTGNTPPTITMPASGLTLPIRTPFQLRGTATDAENPNTLTYCWEQIDIGPPGSPNNPSGDAPIFRSFKPDTSGTRYFPKLANILNNTQTIGEILPTYSRTLTFRLTVRDNNPGAGGVNNELVQYSVDASAGPFLVTFPNTAQTLNSNVPHTVTWDVANTNVAPVSCSNVNIKLSTNGGQSFDIMLASNTANDGTETITLPSLNNSTARVKIEAVGNFFFDLSNVNFTITNTVSVQNNGTGVPDVYSLSQNFPNPFNPSTKISFGIPENSNVSLRILDMSGKEIASLVNGYYSAGNYSVNFRPENVASGIYFYVIRAGNFVESRKMTLIK